MDQAALQRYGASALFIICTLPVALLLIWALLNFDAGALRSGFRILAEPQAPTLYGAYLVTTWSTLMGSVLLPSLKVKNGEATRILPAGLAVLIYTAVVAGCGLIFLLIVAAPETYNVLLAEMPRDGGAAQIKAYASWGVGACLTVLATLLGVPPPKPAES